MAQGAVARRHVRVSGTVQGVGFRPFAYRTAVALGLSGWVGNDGAGVVLEVEGPLPAVEAFLRALEDHPPPLASVEDVRSTAVVPQGGQGFAVVASSSSSLSDLRVSADVAPCDSCLGELEDPHDRRFGYPFINCTDCGPRYSIVRGVPYDRPSTTMADFAMCGLCQAEYDDPADRRFHAQPNACPSCGPQLSWSRDGVHATGAAALRAATECLLSGGIAAVKGVGGYHLACVAGDERVVGELRRRKQRPDKPFAVMVATLDDARALCELDGSAGAVLTSPRRPVVLARRRAAAQLAASVAPRLGEVGVMLPSSPLHHLLLAAAAQPLVMTSGNLSDDPVLHRDDEAAQLLAPLVDGVLAHDRPVHVRVDDSVLRVHGPGRLQMVRRARGWVPQPVRLCIPAGAAVLAVGGHLKSTVALARGHSVVASQHLGDLASWRTVVAFDEALRHLTDLNGVPPALVAHDLHPDYGSTAWALRSGLPLLGVQHHHAHIAACMVEHSVTGPVLGIAFDGFGLGTDGAAWGGELLVADLTRFRRVAHLAPVALPGGDAAVREPWRTALSWLHRSLGPERAAEHGPRLDDRWSAVLSVVASGRAPETTSVGRLFDAVAALLGVCRRVTYEGQAAVELEALASRADASRTPTYPFCVDGGRLGPGPMLQALLQDSARGRPLEQIAAGFHRGLAAATAALAVQQASTHRLDTVALSGGVFSNALLSELLAAALEAHGLRVLRHEQLPPNDGALSVGQAAVAAASTAESAG